MIVIAFRRPASVDNASREKNNENNENNND